MNKIENGGTLSQNDLNQLEDKFINIIIQENITQSSISKIESSKTSFCMEGLSQEISYKSLIDKLKADKRPSNKWHKTENMKKLVHLHSLGEKVERKMMENKQYTLSFKHSETIDSNTLMTHHDIYDYDSKSVS